MKKSTFNKMAKALELLRKAQKLLSEVEKENEQIRYCANSNFRRQDISRAISITESHIVTSGVRTVFRATGYDLGKGKDVSLDFATLEEARESGLVEVLINEYRVIGGVEYYQTYYR